MMRRLHLPAAVDAAVPADGDGVDTLEGAAEMAAAGASSSPTASAGVRKVMVGSGDVGGGRGCCCMVTLIVTPMTDGVSPAPVGVPRLRDGIVTVLVAGAGADASEGDAASSPRSPMPSPIASDTDTGVSRDGDDRATLCSSEASGGETEAPVAPPDTRAALPLAGAATGAGAGAGTAGAGAPVLTAV